MLGVMQNRNDAKPLGRVGVGRWPIVNKRAWKNGSPQEQWDRQEDTLVVLGTGPDWDHVRTEQLPLVQDFLPGAQVMLINHAATLYDGEAHHIVSLHKNLLQSFRAERKRLGLPGNPATHSREKHKGVDYVWTVRPVNGTSGFLAVMAAITMGYQRIILVGVPLGVDGYNIHQAYYINARRLWREVYPHLRRKVRSVYGWTRDKFGTPPNEWKKEVQNG